jgi:hypothetical protein
MKMLPWIVAAALLAPGAAFAADISGAWKITTGGDMPLTLDCKFTQAGSALTGGCGLDGATDPPAQLTGTVDGSTAKWAYDVSFQDQKFHVDFTGDVKDAAMSGNMVVAGMTTPFTATKQ